MYSVRSFLVRCTPQAGIQRSLPAVRLELHARATLRVVIYTVDWVQRVTSDVVVRAPPRRARA